MSTDATRSTWLLNKELITSTEKLFLLACADRASENHECWPSIKRLIADTGLNRKTILSVRQSVIDKGLLTYTGEMKGSTKSIPVMRLTYVQSRDNLSIRSSPKIGSTSPTSSPKIGSTSNDISSPEIGTGKQSQNWDTESKRIEPKRNKEKINKKESEFELDEIIEKAEICLQNTKQNLPVVVGEVKPSEYQETNFSIIPEKPNEVKNSQLKILDQVNVLNLPVELLKDFIDIRKANKASVSPRAIKAAYKELVKLYNAGYDLEECLEVYANAGWKGFFSTWIENALKNKKSSQDRHAHDWSTDWIKNCNLPEQNQG